MAIVNASVKKEIGLTEVQRRKAIIALIEDYTKDNSGDRATARRALIREGIYTQKGKLRVEFGGEGTRAKAAG